MKFNFKIQQYQTDAVDAVVKVFQGQGYHDRISYIRDIGKKQMVQWMQLNVEMDQKYSPDYDENNMEVFSELKDTGIQNERKRTMSGSSAHFTESRKARLILECKKRQSWYIKNQLMEDKIAEQLQLEFEDLFTGKYK